MSLTRREAISLGVAALVASRLPAWSATVAPPASGPLSAAAVGKLLAANKVPGLGMAIVEGSKITTFGYGIARVGGSSVTETTRFQAASLSKTLNALIVLKLVEAGKFTLDDAVNDHLKSWKLEGKSAAKVTVRALLSHTGGTTVSGFAGYEPGAKIPSLLAVLDGKAPANSKRVVASGRLGKFAYSGGGITVLQQMVMDITGETYQAAAKRLVLGPLGMGNSGFEQPPSASDEEKVAYGHGKSGRALKGGFNIYPELAAAGLWTTPHDMALVVRAVFASVNGDSGALLKQATAKEMLKTVDDRAALGTFINPRGRFYHNGVNFGFRCVYVGDPIDARRKGAVLMTNGENGEAVYNKVLENVVKEYGW